MALHSIPTSRLCALLGNRKEPHYPQPTPTESTLPANPIMRAVTFFCTPLATREPKSTRANDTLSADPILVAAMFFCAAEAARADTASPPTGNALAASVLWMVTNSLGFLDTNRAFELAQLQDGRHLLLFESPPGIKDAAIYVPSLAGRQRLQGLDAAIFETGVVLNVFARSLKLPLIPLSSPDALAALTVSGKSFLDGVHALLNQHREAFSVAGAMMKTAVPWAIVTSDQRSRDVLQRVVESGVTPANTDSAVVLAYRHLLQTAIVTDFVVKSLNEHIDKGQPLPDHEAVAGAVTNASPDWIVEPARSMLLETVAYSSNRTARQRGNPKDSVSNWMQGARFAWRGLMSSRIPRHAKYVAENLAQASKMVDDPFGKKCADAIFCGAYTIGHLWKLVSVTGYSLGLESSEENDAKGYLCSEAYRNEWEAIPAYSDDPFFVQRFMSDSLKVTADNLVVNLLSGVILLEQFLRDTPAKMWHAKGIEEVRLITAYTHQPANVFHFEDRPMLFNEPFLWAYDILRGAYDLGEDGVRAILNCGYTSLVPGTAASVSNLLELATTPEKGRVSRPYAEVFPGLVRFLNVLAGKCPENTNEREYLLNLASGLETEFFS